MSRMKRIIALCLAMVLALGLAACGTAEPSHGTEPSATEPVQTTEPDTEPTEQTKPQPTLPTIEYITVKEAIAIAENAGETPTSEVYYVKATVKTVSKPQYGEMTIMDETGEIYVYGTADGNGVGYADMALKPVAGDEIVICGSLKMYKDSAEFGKSTIVEFHHEDAVADGSYSAMSINKARGVAVGTKASLSGVVAKITYASGMTPNGFYLLDATGSIYVYGTDVAGQVSEGNRITIEGEKEMYISDKEITYAQTYGYTGCIQIVNPRLIKNDNGINDLPLSWVSTTTVKQIVENPTDNNITTNIYKVKAYVKKSQGDGFVNYYINDLDGKTGSYVYTACNGSDFEYLEEFDGKICTVYLSAINCKSSNSGCVYRFIPILVTNDGFTFDMKEACGFAYEYGLDFKGSYTFEVDPCITLPTEIKYDIFDGKAVTVSYETGTSGICFIVEEGGNLILHTGNPGTDSVIVRLTCGDVTLTKTVEVIVEGEVKEIDALNVSQAAGAELDKEVTVKGVIAAGIANQVGFYLVDETGAIAVKVSSDTMATLKIGDEVVVTGTRTMWSKHEKSVGHSVIADATVVANYHGDHSYATDSFVTDWSLAQIRELPVDEDHTTQIYKVTAMVVLKDGTNATYSLVDGDTTIQLYSSSAKQYSFLEQFNEQEVTVHMALCNWNDKTSYKAYVMAVETADGLVLNTNNFQK